MEYTVKIFPDPEGEPTPLPYVGYSFVKLAVVPKTAIPPPVALPLAVGFRPQPAWLHSSELER